MVHDQLDVIAGMLGRQTTKVESMLRDAATDLLALAGFPPTDVVGVFPHPEALMCLASAVLVEAHDEWQPLTAATSPRTPWLVTP